VVAQCHKPFAVGAEPLAGIGPTEPWTGVADQLDETDGLGGVWFGPGALRALLVLHRGIDQETQNLRPTIHLR